ncbi:MAG: radical SAM protein [Deltaproteobacteria bacterium]|nr:radical SAM protein [Deltaproteobacteria bacterium]
MTVPKKGEKIFTLSDAELHSILKRREKHIELDPGMGGVSPRLLDNLLKSDSELVSLDLAITAACNFRCGHCYKPNEEWNKQVLDFATLSRVVEEAVQILGTRFFVITGGEPLMYNSEGRDYFDVVDKIIEVSNGRGFKPHVLTFSDVALINEQTAAKLATRKVALCLKRDTLDHAIQNKILGVSRGSEQMAAGYQTLFAAGYGKNPELAVSVNTVLRKGDCNTLNGSVDLHVWVKENGMEHSIVPIHHCGGAIDEDQDLNPLEVKVLYDILSAIDEIKFNDVWKVHSPFPKDKTCNRPGRGVHARVTGKVAACSESPLIDPYVFGNINEISLTTMIRSDGFRKFQQEFASREGKYICNPEVCDLNRHNICRGGCATRSAYSVINPETGQLEQNTNMLSYSRGREDPMCPGWAVLAQMQGVLREGVYKKIADRLLGESMMLDPQLKGRISEKILTEFAALKKKPQP